MSEVLCQNFMTFGRLETEILHQTCQHVYGVDRRLFHASNVQKSELHGQMTFTEQIKVTHEVISLMK